MQKPTREVAFKEGEIVNERDESLIERCVTYTLKHAGQFYLIENVPARVDEETGEQFFAPLAVERLQRMTAEKRPDRVVETSVYEYDGAA